MKFIEENLEKIANPQDVLFIGTGKDFENKNKRLLKAVMFDGTKLPLTESQSAFTYPDEPLYKIDKKLTEPFRKSFSSIGLFGLYDFAVNVDLFDSFDFENSENTDSVIIKINFKNNVSLEFCDIRKKYFEKAKKQLLEFEEKVKKYQDSKQVLKEDKVENLEEDKVENLEDSMIN